MQATAWFLELEAQWYFALMYFKTSQWLPNLYRNEDFWASFELKCLVLNLGMTAVYVVLSLIWWIDVDINDEAYNISFVIPGSVPIVLMLYSLYSIRKTTEHYEKRERL